MYRTQLRKIDEKNSMFVLFNVDFFAKCKFQRG